MTCEHIKCDTQRNVEDAACIIVEVCKQYGLDIGEKLDVKISFSKKDGITLTIKEKP